MPHRGLTVLANSELITRLRYRLGESMKLKYEVRINDRLDLLVSKTKLDQQCETLNLDTAKHILKFGTEIT
jgi:hypothetical protein